MFTTKLADRWGRRKCLLICDVFLLLGALLTCLSPAYWMIVVGRLLSGVGVGGASILVPLLLTEISRTKRRGSMGVMNQFYISVSPSFLSFQF